MDSEYLHREVRTKTMELLKENEAYGALEEFQEAIHDLTSSDTKDAIIKAHKSVESTMKSILGNDCQEYRFGQLLHKLINSGNIPEYYEDFFKNFEQLALVL
jgi:HEPN domain-containing protein